MKIGILADMIDFGYRGVGIYSYNLISQILKLDHENEYWIIHNEGGNVLKEYAVVITRANELKIRPFPGFRNKYETERLITRLKYPKVLKKMNFDLIHDLSNLYALTPSNTGSKMVITFHEVTSIPYNIIDKFSVFFTFRALRKLKSELGKVHIIAISNNTKKDLVEFGIPEEKISVIYQGVNHEIFKPLKVECRPFPYPYILYVGSNAPRKNLGTLIKGFYLLKKKGFQQKLVLVTTPNKELQNLIDSLKLQNEVIFKQKIPTDELCYLYNCADVFVLPSLFEGFGLPPLEAMACGCPVIVSNVASLPEVVGDAGILFNPLSVEDLTLAMENVLQNEALRNDLRRRGLERARLFSWERTARETIRVYKEVIS